MTTGATAKGGEEIRLCNLPTNISFATDHQSTSLHPSATAPNLSDEEEISAWIYKS